MNRTELRAYFADEGAPLTDTGIAALLAMPDNLPFTPSKPKPAPVAPAPVAPAPVAPAPVAPAPVAPDTLHELAGRKALPAPLARTFMLAGNATFTIVSHATGNRFTFKVSRPKDDNARTAPRRKVLFIGVLSGPQNDSDYTYLGNIWEDAEKFTYQVGRKSRVTADAPSQKAALWVTKLLNNPDLMAQCDIYHAGKCGRCGRTLTVPSSIEAGIGPECAGRM